MGGFKYNYLPGVQVQTVDGGLISLTSPTTKSTIILGTSGAGPAGTPFQVTDLNAAALAFGQDGTLYRGMQELTTYCDNILLYRIGTKAATLNGVGATTGSGSQAGINIQLGEVADSTGDDYKIWYAAGVLYLWLNGNLVYANDTNLTVDTGDSTVVDTTPGGTTGGLALGTQVGPTAKTILGAVKVNSVFTASGNNLAPTYTVPDTGLGMSMRQTYIALEEAYDLLTNFPIKQAWSPNVVLDNPNVAFYVSSDSTTATNNPATNSDALDWLQTTQDANGNNTYHWASETTDSAGTNVGAATFTDAADRISQGYHEVNFGYQLARFAAAQSAVLGGCMGFIGTSSPSRFDLPSIRTWFGYLPTYNATTAIFTANNQIEYGVPTAPGKGLLGIPYMTGTTSAKLNAQTVDGASLGYRLPGFFQTDTEEYDGSTVYDQNKNPIDIGAYLHVVGDTAFIINGYGQYHGNIAGLTAGLHSSLDANVSIMNQPLTSAVQLYRASLGQLDALTEAKINVLRYKGQGQAPVLLHDRTAAHNSSDYIFVNRQDIKFLVCQVIFNKGNAFIGQTSTDGLQMQALHTAIDAEMQRLQKTGYIASYSFTISTTQAGQRVGIANVSVKFVPAFELVQLLASVGLQQG